MKNLQFNPYQCETEWGWDEPEWVGSKKSILILAPPHGVGLISHPILSPPPLRGRENPRGVKWGWAGQAERGKIVIPSITRANARYN